MSEGASVSQIWGWKYTVTRNGNLFAYRLGDEDVVHVMSDVESITYRNNRLWMRHRNGRDYVGTSGWTTEQGFPSWSPV